MPGLGYARTLPPGKIPAVNQPEPQLTPLPPPPGPRPAAVPPLAAQPATAPLTAVAEPEPRRKASIPDYMSIIGQTLSNMSAAAQGKDLPYTYANLLQAQREEDRYQLDLIKTQAQIAKLPPRERTALLAKMPGLKQGVESLLGSGLSEEDLQRQADGYLDLSEGAQEELVAISRMDNIPLHEVYKNYREQLYQKTDMDNIAVFTRGGGGIKALLDQTSYGPEIEAQFMARGGMSIAEAMQLPFAKDHPSMTGTFERNPDRFAGIIRTQKMAEEESARAWEREKMGLQHENQLALKGPPESFESISPEDVPPYQVSTKTGKVTATKGQGEKEPAPLEPRLPTELELETAEDKLGRAGHDEGQALEIADRTRARARREGITWTEAVDKEIAALPPRIKEPGLFERLKTWVSSFGKEDWEDLDPETQKKIARILKEGPKGRSGATGSY